MIIESQNGMAMAVMGDNSCLELNNYYEGCEINFVSVGCEIMLGKFHEFNAAKWELRRIMEAYLNGEKLYKVKDRNGGEAET